MAEKSAKRDGRFIERIGFFNPVAKGSEAPLRIDLERLDYWLACGAQPSERVRQLAAQLRRTQAAQAPGAGAAEQSELGSAPVAAPVPDEAAPTKDAPEGNAAGEADAAAAAPAEDSATAL